MVAFSAADAAKAVNGTLYNGDVLIEKVSTDSRDNLDVALFVAIKGEFFDGHEFIYSAYAKNAVCVFTENTLDTQKPYIKVSSTKQALMDLAKWYLEKFDIKVVAITGSVGKTTTKDMIASVLSKKYKVSKSQGNFNNEIGLPLTIFSMAEDTEIAVLEMGMNSFGEIHNLSKIATPEICVIINIGVAHIGLLGSREGILKAKSEIFDFAENDAIAILNGEDDMLCSVEGRLKKTYLYGFGEKHNCKAVKTDDFGLKGTRWTVYFEGEEINIKIPYPGDYLIENAMAAVCAGKILGVSNEKIACGIADFKVSKNRMDIFDSAEGVTVINDVYNSNPVSVKAMINALGSKGGAKACILGDMLELGDEAEKFHSEIGEFAQRSGIDMGIFIGELSKYSYDAFKIGNKGNGYYFKTLNDFLENGLNLIKKDYIVLIKASRGMKFEKIIERLGRV